VKATVSVALCTYNGERFVAEQLRSILAQSSPPSQIVVSDDGSTDATVAVVERELASSGIDVTVIRGESPLGVTGNFERAIAAATGDIVVLCDQDDVWHPQRLSAAVADLEADPAALLWHSDARLVDESGADLGLSLFETLGVGEAELAAINRGDAFAQFIRRNLVTGATVVFRRELLAASLPFPSQWVHDEWLAVIAAATGRVRASSTALIDYRQHSANVIGVTRPTMRTKIDRMLEQRGDRYRRLSARADILVERLETVGVAPDTLALARAKRDFERVRAAYPAARIARVRQVVAAFRRGDYARLSSQGNLDVVRDLLHHA